MGEEDLQICLQFSQRISFHKSIGQQLNGIGRRSDYVDASETWLENLRLVEIETHSKNLRQTQKIWFLPDRWKIADLHW